TLIFRKKFAVNTTLAKSSAAVRLCSMYCDRSSRSPGLIPPCSSWARPAQARNSSHEPFTTAARAKNRVLVKVNCGAISTGLVESELFGHVKGPFTGAISNRDGRFKLADSGTIFLDEVGELPLDTQVKLLRVLQEQEFESIGSSKTIKVNVRIVATTNRDLEELVREGKFRADLFYRLNVVPLRVPALRERVSDLPLLVTFFVQKCAKKLSKRITSVSEKTMHQLSNYSWPGNIRELQNIVE